VEERAANQGQVGYLIEVQRLMQQHQQDQRYERASMDSGVVMHWSKQHVRAVAQLAAVKRASPYFFGWLQGAQNLLQF
jgi:hypothetical protein